MKNDLFALLAKIHCVADSDCINTPKDVACLPFSIIPKHTEKTIRDAIRGRDADFVEEMVEFGMVRKKSIFFRQEFLFYLRSMGD